MNHLEAIYTAAQGRSASYIQSYFARMSELMQCLDPQALERMVQAMEHAAAAGKTIYLIANGGSSAVASHMVNDLVVLGLMPDQVPLRALALSDNAASVLSIGNDFGFEQVFERQLKALLNPGDLVIAISGSGNSPNVLKAVEAATASGCRTIGMTGRNGGRLGPLVQLNIHVDEQHMGRIEDVHVIVCHMIAYSFMDLEGSSVSTPCQL
jgi:D-sedoheptulose 7-phosphate isomerase